MTTPTNRAAAIDALRTELRQIDGPLHAWDPWFEKVRDVNARLAAEGQPQLGLAELSDLVWGDQLASGDPRGNRPRYGRTT